MNEEDYSDEQLERCFKGFQTGEAKRKLVDIVLFRLAGVQGFSFLVDKLTKGNQEQQDIALSILEAFPCPKAYEIGTLLPVLMEFFEQKHLQSSRQNAMKILHRHLERFQLEAYLPMLRHLLFDDDAEIRIGAAVILGELEDEKAVLSLSYLLTDEAKVASAAYLALYMIDTPYAHYMLQEWEKRR